MTKEQKSLLYDVVNHPHRLGYLVGKDKLTELHSHWIKFIWYPTEYFKHNDNWKDTIKFFNKLGPVLDVPSEDNKSLVRVKLNKKLFFELVNRKHRSLKAHRGSYKSTAINIIGVLMRLLLEPDIRIGIVRKEFTKASNMLKNISAIMKKEEMKELFRIYHNIVPKAIKDADKILTFNFKQTITPEGNVNAYGLHGNITGDHLDFIVFDDFITIQDKISKAERDKTKLRLEEIVNFVLDPEKQAGFVGTCWHKDDAWTMCPPPLNFDVYTLDILNKKQIDEKRRTTTNVTFAAQFELRHVASEDVMFVLNNDFKRWEFEYRNGIGHLDKKYHGVDTNALTFCALKRNGRYQVIGWVWNDHIKEKVEFIKKKWEKYRIGTIHSEDNDDKGLMSDRLRDAHILMQTYHESMNKHVKIKDHLLENGFWDLIDFDPDTDPEYLNQILDYVEGSEPDDAPDSLATLGRILISSKSSVYTDRWKK
jgi:hypothetical protein